MTDPGLAPKIFFVVMREFWFSRVEKLNLNLTSCLLKQRMLSRLTSSIAFVVLAPFNKFVFGFCSSQRLLFLLIDKNHVGLRTMIDKNQNHYSVLHEDALKELLLPLDQKALVIFDVFKTTK